MKILYLHQYFNTPEMIGSSRSYDIAIKMVEKGHSVEMITSDRTGQGNSWRTSKVDGIKVHWLPQKYSNNMGSVTRVVAFLRYSLLAGLKASRIGGDIVFATSTPLTIAIPAIYAKWRLKIPMVFEVRDLWPSVPIALNVIKNPVLKYLANFLEKIAYLKAKKIIVLSSDMQNAVLQNHSVDPDNVFSIPNVSHLERFRSETDKGKGFRNRYEWLGDRPLVLYAGTLGRVNGVSYIVQLAARLKKLDSNIRILVMGTGIEEEKIKDLARKLKVYEENFFMLEPLSKREIPSVFAAANMTMSTVIQVPELYANSANKFFDSLAAGKPIAINHAGWQKNIIQEARVGLALHPTEYEIAAMSVFNLLRNKDELSLMSRNALQTAKSLFSSEKLTGKVVEILEGCLKEEGKERDRFDDGATSSSDG